MNNISSLKWITTSTSPEKKYELWNDKEKLLNLTYHSLQQTAKIECEESRRLFHIENKGIFKNKTILKNEYGIEVGQLGFELLKQNAGFIDLNDEHFHFAIQNKKIVIYKPAAKIPLLICSIATAYKNTVAHFIKNKEETYNNQACLLITLCWFLFLPSSKRTGLPYAM